MINADDLQPGVWVELEKNNPIAFGIAVVELAMNYGLKRNRGLWRSVSS